MRSSLLSFVVLLAACGDAKPSEGGASTPTTSPATTSTPPDPIVTGTNTDTETDTATMATDTAPDTSTTVDTGGTTDTAPLPVGDVADLALQPHATVENGRFSTADVCATCHDNAPNATAMRDEDDRPIAPYDLWQSSMMANAGRDPLWRAQFSAELAATPAADVAIGAKCTRCHAPMASADAELLGDPAPTADVLVAGTERTALALDGVSCTACHQIENEGLGTDASFSGGYVIDGSQTIYGPHDNPFSHPMEQHSGFTPVSSRHVMDSALCASCHTLTTHALAADGTETGGTVVEQGPYLEWQVSDFADDTSCQDCHLPTTSVDGRPINTHIAHNPGGMNFPPTSERSPYGRHTLVGGNTLIPSILKDQRAVLSPPASDEAFDATIAEARTQLSERTGTVTLDGLAVVSDVLSIDARVGALTGHKLPSGIPVRRAWLRVSVTDAAGAEVFASGGWDDAGRLLDGAGQVLASVEVGGPILPHVDQVTSDDQVAVYEAVLADAAGDPTFLLMRGEGWVKDTRLLPAGFDRTAAAALGIDAVGVSGDADFVGGSDTVHYAIDVAGAQRPLTVEAELVYQPLAARWAAELFASATPEALAFQLMYEAAERGPERVALATAEVP